jgi:predicted nucleic acid-binding protein
MCFVYMFEAPDTARGSYMRALFEDQANTFVTSSITVSELLVKRYQVGPAQRVDDARLVIEETPRLVILPVDNDVAQEAARIRAVAGFRLPDALQAATAVRSGAAAFVTNDRRLARTEVGVPVIVLDDALQP